MKLKYDHLKINHFNYYILLPRLQFWQMTVLPNKLKFMISTCKCYPTYPSLLQASSLSSSQHPQSVMIFYENLAAIFNKAISLACTSTDRK